MRRFIHRTWRPVRIGDRAKVALGFAAGAAVAAAVASCSGGSPGSGGAPTATDSGSTNGAPDAAGVPRDAAPETSSVEDAGPPRDATTSGSGDGASGDGSSGEASSADASGADASMDGGTDATVDAAQEAGFADGGDAGDCDFGDAGESLDLRCTGLYADWSTKTVSADVHVYDPGLHLWSDGATKTRWIYLPPGTDGGLAPIDTSDMDEWTFPIGTKVWKEFVLEGKRIETRLIWKQGPNLWYLTTYRWSPDGSSSATELTDGELDADGNGYEVPTQAECRQCHNGRRDKVLGFEAVALSSAGATPVTMQTLVDSGWITEAPDASLVIPGNAADVAALGYLHTNCGIACHNRGSGLADGTGFFMRLDVATLGSVQSTDTWQTGVGKVGYFTPPGATSPLMRLAPDDAGASCVYVRMSARTGLDDAAAGIQMPPIDTHKVDEAGVAIVAQWINQGCQ